MPPRARKTAAKPMAADDGLLPAEPVADAATESPSPSDGAPEGQQPALAPDPAQDVAEPETPRPDVAAAPAAPVEPTSHWELVGLPGIEDSPCRLCLHGGAPEGAGSIGCQHGQWVRVWDGA